MRPNLALRLMFAGSSYTQHFRFCGENFATPRRLWDTPNQRSMRSLSEALPKPLMPSWGR